MSAPSTTIAQTARRPGRSLRGSGLIAVMRHWHLRHVTRHALAGLEPHRLADIGLDLPAARAETAKRFWQD